MIGETSQLSDGNNCVQKLKKLAVKVHSLGLKVLIWIPELDIAPDNFLEKNVVKMDRAGFGDWLKQGFLKSDPGVTVQSKCVPHDWDPYYPHNPLIGAFPTNKQNVEFDCSSEFIGKNRTVVIFQIISVFSNHS